MSQRLVDMQDVLGDCCWQPAPDGDGYIFGPPGCSQTDSYAHQDAEGRVYAFATRLALDQRGAAEMAVAVAMISLRLPSNWRKVQ